MTLKKTVFTAISAIALLAGGTITIATFSGTDKRCQN